MSKKVVRKDQLLHWRSLHNWVGISRLLSGKVYVNREDWDRNTPSYSPKALGTKSKFGKERVHCVAKSVRLMSAVFARPNSRIDHMRKRWPKNDAPATQRGIWRTLFWSVRIRTKLRLCPGEVKGMSTPVTSKIPEEREFVVDSGASMHMTSKKEELGSKELWTVKRSRTPTVVLTANGEVYTHDGAQVFVHDSNQFVTVQLLEETPVVLSQGVLCKDHGYSYECVNGQEPRLTPTLMTACRTLYPSLAWPWSCRVLDDERHWKRVLSHCCCRERVCVTSKRNCATYGVWRVPMQGVVHQCRFVKRHDEDLRTGNKIQRNPRLFPSRASCAVTLTSASICTGGTSMFQWTGGCVMRKLKALTPSSMKF